jgi:hypothetical protein
LQARVIHQRARAKRIVAAIGFTTAATHFVFLSTKNVLCIALAMLREAFDEPTARAATIKGDAHTLNRYRFEFVLRIEIRHAVNDVQFRPLYFNPSARHVATANVHRLAFRGTIESANVDDLRSLPAVDVPNFARTGKAVDAPCFHFPGFLRHNWKIAKPYAHATKTIKPANRKSRNGTTVKEFAAAAALRCLLSVGNFPTNTGVPCQFPSPLEPQRGQVCATFTPF